MTDEGLLIPGRLLRNMGEKIAVTFSPRLIVISSRPSSTLKRKPKKADRRSPTAKNGRREMSPEQVSNTSRESLKQVRGKSRTSLKQVSDKSRTCSDLP